MSTHLFNPKSKKSSVHLAAWILQDKTISPTSKLVFGRIAMWKKDGKNPFRSAKQLSTELGMSVRSIERSLRELKDLKLIKTYHPQAGGSNHFEFLHHEIIDKEIHPNLQFKNTKNPCDDEDFNIQNMAVPSAKSVGTPPPTLADINKNKIKNKTTTTNPPLSQQPKTQPAVAGSSSEYFIFSKATDQRILSEKLQSDNRSDEEFLKEGKLHIETQSDLSYSEFQRINGLINILRKCKRENTAFKARGSAPLEKAVEPIKQQPPKQHTGLVNNFSQEELMLLGDYAQALKMLPRDPNSFNVFFKDEGTLARAKMLYEQAEAAREAQNAQNRGLQSNDSQSRGSFGSRSLSNIYTTIVERRQTGYSSVSAHRR